MGDGIGLEKLKVRGRPSWRGQGRLRRKKSAWERVRPAIGNLGGKGLHSRSRWPNCDRDCPMNPGDPGVVCVSSGGAVWKMMRIRGGHRFGGGRGKTGHAPPRGHLKNAKRAKLFSGRNGGQSRGSWEAINTRFCDVRKTSHSERDRIRVIGSSKSRFVL